MTYTDYADDQVLLANTPIQEKTILHCLEYAVGEIDSWTYSNQAGQMYFKQSGIIATLSGKWLKLIDQLKHLGIQWKWCQHIPIKGVNGSSEVIYHIEILSLRWNETEFLSNCNCVRTILCLHLMNANKTHTEKSRFEQNNNAMSILKQIQEHSTKQQLSGHLPPISQTIQVWQSNMWILMSDVF